ncbi:TPA: DMT family transporter [Photobacterium damselae]
MNKNHSVGFAMLILIVGNLIAVFSDALVKTVGADSPVFQFVFFRQLTAVLMLLPFCYRYSLSSFTSGIKWHALRGHIWLLGAIGMFISLNTMPLATANAIFYAAPLLMLPLAMFIYNEKLTRYSLFAAICGFTGVLVVIRPTEISWSAIAALVVAVTLALNNLLIRKLPAEQTVIQTLFLTNLVGMPASLTLALLEGKPWDWGPLLTAAGSSALILIYAGSCVVAYRSAESSKIASAEYSGLIGAVGVGILWFNELPDIYMLIGTIMIVVPIAWLANVEKRKQKVLAAQTQPLEHVAP